jgi:hypothetical protein
LSGLRKVCWICIDIWAAEESAACCGVNLAGNSILECLSAGTGDGWVPAVGFRPLGPDRWVPAAGSRPLGSGCLVPGAFRLAVG